MFLWHDTPMICEFQFQFHPYDIDMISSLNKVMSMIPGLSNMIGPGKEKESVDRIKRFMCIMDSMNQQGTDAMGAMGMCRAYMCMCML